MFTRRAYGSAGSGPALADSVASVVSTPAMRARTLRLEVS